MIAKIESRCQCVNVQRVNVCKAMRHPAKELDFPRIVDAARLFLSIYHWCPLLSSLHSDGYFGIHSWTVDLDNLFFAYARLHEVLRILLQHLVDRTYCEPLSVCRSVQRKMRNGSLTQGGKKFSRDVSWGGPWFIRKHLVRANSIRTGSFLFSVPMYRGLSTSVSVLHQEPSIRSVKIFYVNCLFPVNLSKLILLL